MFVRALAVRDFRSWDAVDLTLEPGRTVFVGANGNGKTNLLEALGYLASLSSHRVSSDAALVRGGTAQAAVYCFNVTDGSGRVVQINICNADAQGGEATLRNVTFHTSN